ncbi:MAG: hypothetical protein M2R45_05155 [Verrucomicrobia subdivision 3 bacterium]|nr:hypothetical protein [Limisphaerales bacterium]MCS1413798.1 hypothetical protein [Limisphaerales bacterium]
MACSITYVNDRSYLASSFLSVVISKVFESALSSRSKDGPDLGTRAMPLSVVLPTLPCRGGVGLLEKLFGPLGYHVSAYIHLVDSLFRLGNDQYS